MNAKTTNISIRMDVELKQRADELFSNLGMNLSTGFNIFVRQAIREKGLPFKISLNVPNMETEKALKEAEEIAHDPNTKGYNNIQEALAELKS